MPENYVKKEEFEEFKKEFNALKDDRKKDVQLLIAIDKKVDVIFEKITNSSNSEELKIKVIEEKEDLKLQPIKEKIAKIEKHQIWLWETVIGTIIGVIIKFIVK